MRKLGDTHVAMLSSTVATTESPSTLKSPTFASLSPETMTESRLPQMSLRTVANCTSGCS